MIPHIYRGWNVYISRLECDHVFSCLTIVPDLVLHKLLLRSLVLSSRLGGFSKFLEACQGEFNELFSLSLSLDLSL
jgi:hypothetical protein